MGLPSEPLKVIIETTAATSRKRKAEGKITDDFAKKLATNIERPTR